MNNERQAQDTCGCCEGITQSTPALIENRPGLSSVVYRAGVHGSFKASMLAALGRERSLSGLTTRDSNDFTIALLDAWAVVADVLTFYQERIANESYLRTATERFSVHELARLIGYQLSPGVTAGTYLAFTIDEPPKLPQVAMDRKVSQAYARLVPPTVKIEKGTKVQSIPGQDEQAQVFETVEAIEARADWNELKPQQSEPKIPHYGDKEVYLQGVETGLKPGDPLLFIGKERHDDPRSDRWDFRKVSTITINRDVGYTQVTWKEGLGWRRGRNIVLPAEKDFAVFAFRQRASVFGHNAPDWRAMPDTVKKGFLGKDPTPADVEWSLFNIDSDDTIHLDAVYPQILQSSWVVLSVPDYEEVYDVVEVEEESSEDFTLTAKTTRLKLRGENLREKFGDKRPSKAPEYGRRDITVFGQSERIELAQAPLIGHVPGSPTEKVECAEGVLAPVDGNQITLDRLVPGLQKGHSLIVSGKRLKAKVADSVKPNQLRLVTADGIQVAALEAGQILTVLGSPSIDAKENVTWHLKTSDGTEGKVTANTDEIIFVASAKEDAPFSELAVVEEASGDPTTVTLQESLRNTYDRPTATVLANVARATHGETVREVLGSGDASQPFQRFTLRQPPLTHVSSPSASGRETTLAVRVNDILWKEVPTLLGHGPDERIYATRTENDGTTVVQFGDGRTGARIPTGQENIRAMCRKGIGLGGVVKAGQLSLLLDRPLGVKEVVNPLPATGAEDPEKLDQAKLNAPLTVLTMDRVVSLQDYEDFARAFAGIAKALATVVWNGEKRGIFITVAGPKGADIVEGSNLHNNLMKALRDAGDSTVSVSVKSYRPVTFTVRAAVKIHPDYLFPKVRNAVQDALMTRYSFDARQFGQYAAMSEVVSVVQAVPGVTAVRLEEFRDQKGNNGLQQPLRAALPEQELDGSIAGAELLTINPRTIAVEEMS